MLETNSSKSMPIIVAVGFFVIMAIFSVILVLGVKNNKSKSPVNQTLGVEAQSPTPESGLFLGSEQKETLPDEVKGLLTPTPAPKSIDFEPDITPTPTPLPLFQGEAEGDIQINL